MDISMYEKVYPIYGYFHIWKSISDKWIFPYMETYLRHMDIWIMMTCKEGVTEPTTELEFSERNTTEEVPYLGFNILSYSKNLAVSPVIFWEYELNIITPCVLGFDF